MKENVRTQANAMKGINDITMKGEIVVFGSTYMSSFPLYELFNKCMFENAVYNRSIEGLTVKEALEIVRDCVIEIHPSKIFLALGEEDENDPDVMNEYTALVSELRSQLPECKLYLIALTGAGMYVERFNRGIMQLCDGKTIKYIDFISKRTSEMALYRARFKQLSCFFRDRPLTMSEALVMADI
ncbi:MAG: hypothetical protein IJF49_07265 [Clostridia bacterium]|nr:hypothetical protein [Clostridia bacterium]